ncbi:MAG: transcription antitermination factor NusB [Bacteroidetes bacterium]|jgi:N utilization substance protein B|nr:transcription antitermination factor NusB [Bacteroidota bacterium]
MLARRHLRIRVLQTLYTYFQYEGYSQAKAEKDLVEGTERLYDLYLTLLQLLVELAEQETLYRIDVASKFIVNKKEFTRSFSKTQFISWLSEFKPFTTAVSKSKISWQADMEAVGKCFYKLRHNASYRTLTMTNDELNEQEWMQKIYKTEIEGSEFVTSVLEEKNIWWAESLSLAHSMVVKTIRMFYTASEKSILPLYKDEEDDRDFMVKLLKETIKHDKEWTSIIAARTKNWDVERIALTDIIMLKMAITEFMQFKQIPLKVTMNEYIDISKDYSTPQSKMFINGVLDKVVEDLRTENKIVKTGRGLVEN